MYMLAHVFQFLAEKRPDIDADVFAYAKAGFGDLCGFPVGLSLLDRRHVFYWVLITATGSSLTYSVTARASSRFIVSLVGVWVFHFLILVGCT
jgi:arginine:ornithine antiporter/lysine permease